MKKIILFLLAVIFSLNATGCATPVVKPSFDAEKPWGKGIDSYEKCTYKVEYVERVKNGEATVNGQVVARGEMVYELEMSQSGIASFVDLSMSFFIEYDDIDKAGLDRGLRDEINSTVRFTNDSLSSIYSEKTVKLAARPKSSSENVFVDTQSYKVVADYNTSKATAYKGQKVDPVTGLPQKVKSDTNVEDSDYKTIKDISLISDSTIYDNEQFFYTVRALKSLAPESSQSLNNSNIYEISSSVDKKGKYSPVGMTVSVAKDYTVRKLDRSIAEGYLTPDANDEYPVNCMTVNLAKSASPSGPPITLLITDKSVEFSNKTINTKTGKVIVEIRQVFYDLTTRAEAFNLVYTLTDYTTMK